jgi:RNA polymerase sigma factor (sigma-70 family)
MRNPSISCEDISSDTIEKLLYIFRDGTFRSESSLKTYVQKITKFTMIDAMRRRRRIQNDSQEILDEAVDPDSFTEVFERAEEYALYRRMYDLIPMECRNLWKMLFHEELSQAEAAERIGITGGALKTRVFRCKERAREIIRRIS